MNGTAERSEGRVPDSTEKERRLVDGLLRRTQSAISDFLERTHHPVYCMACRLTLDPERRRDWTHNALLGILSDLERGCFEYRRPGSFWAWFRKRVHYRLLDEYRRERRGAKRELPLEPGEEDALASSLDNPVEQLERAEFLSAVEGCLDRLASRQQRRAVRLLLLEDLSYQDIADAMSAPLNTVRAWIRRGRLALRRCLAATLGMELSEASND